MRARTDEKAQLVLGAVETKPAVSFVINQLGAGGREVVACGRQNQQGFGADSSI